MTRRIDEPDTDADRQLRDYLAVGNRCGFVMVAGAGSGKTTSLIKALDYISHTFGPDLRKHGQQVACITYTEIAVGEIWGDVGNNPLFHVSTIHSFLWGLASPFQSDIGKWVRRRMEEKLVELRQEQANFGARVQQKTRDRNLRATERLERQLPQMNGVAGFNYGTGSNYAEGILGHDDIIKMVPQLIQEKPLLTSVIAQKYPFVFVDESQDTVPAVVEALRAVAQRKEGIFCLGFFGDPMQKVYTSGTGEIVLEPTWKKIEKPENFRCPSKVLAVINNIRAKGDGLQQTRGRHESIDGVERPVVGTARCFVLPADNGRPANLTRVREWLAHNDGNPEWTSDVKESGVRILVIEHRMAAVRLGFGQLHSAFKDGAPDKLFTSFREGKAWPLKPFRDVLLPLVDAFTADRQFEVMTLLRKHSGRLEQDALRNAKEPGYILANIKQDVQRLVELMSSTSNATVRDVLLFANEAKLVQFDERLRDYVAPMPAGASEPAAGVSEENEEDEAQKTATAMANYLACPANQIRGYDDYQKDLSRYSTQQGVKGAQFARVIVVLDDDESNQFLFSYDKLLGLKAPSKTDIENQNNGQESVFERTRRLLYVCCSRATHDLAVVLYTQKVEEAAALIRAFGLFDSLDVHTL